MLQIPLLIIRKRAFSCEAKWRAEKLDTPLLTCEYAVFRDGVRKSVLPILLFPLNQNCVAVTPMTNQRRQNYSCIVSR